MMTTKQQNRMVRHGLRIALAAFPVGVFAAPTPDAGQALREMQSVPPAMPAPAKPVTPLEAPETAPAPSATAVRVKVRAFHVTGSTAFRPIQLESLVSALVGSERSLEELNEAARTITRFYRQHGYPVARAFLPPQTISDGDITIQVLEGRVDRIELKNQSGVSGARLQAMIDRRLHGGDVLRSGPLNATLLSLNDLPGIGVVQGALHPGEAVGTSRVVIVTPAGPSTDGTVILDNQGSRYTGRNRLTGDLGVNNPLQVGDRLNLRLSVSDEQLAYGRAAWDRPVGSSGLRLGANLAYSRYELGDAFASLDAHGTSKSAGLTAAWPWVLEIHRRINVNASLEQRKLTDVVGATATTTDKTLNALTVSLDGQCAENGRSTRWSLGGTLGNLDIGTPAALAADKTSAKTNGSYTRLTVSGSTVKAFAPRWEAALSANAQWADKNLDSSEKFLLGGAGGVRAYPSGEGLGDIGWLASVEARYRLADNWQGVVFYDVGGVKINETAYAAGPNGRHLSAEGVGLNASPFPAVSLRLMAGWHAGGEKAVSESDHTPRVWAQAGYRF